MSAFLWKFVANDFAYGITDKSDVIRLLQKAAFTNLKGGTTQSFRYAQRRYAGRRKRYVRKAHFTMRRYRRFALRSLIDN